MNNVLIDKHFSRTLNPALFKDFLEVTLGIPNIELAFKYVPDEYLQKAVEEYSGRSFSELAGRYAEAKGYKHRVNITDRGGYIFETPARLIIEDYISDSGWQPVDNSNLDFVISGDENTVGSEWFKDLIDYAARSSGNGIVVSLTKIAPNVFQLHITSTSKSGWYAKTLLEKLTKYAEEGGTPERVTENNTRRVPIPELKRDIRVAFFAGRITKQD